jgi:hypothetical protein
MTLSNLLLILFIFLLLGARPARRNSWSKQDLYWYKDCLMQDENGWRQDGTGNTAKENGNMNILEHTDQGAIIKLDQRELLLVMALVQEGRESFGCNTESGQALDELFSSANRLVEESRRRAVGKPVTRQKIHLVADPSCAQVVAVSRQ